MCSIFQVNIPSNERQKIMKELTEISYISHALNAIEIAIGFLSSTITPADEEQPYENYLRDNLKMDIVKCIPSRKVV